MAGERARHHVAIWLPRRFYAAVAATLAEMFELVNTVRGEAVFSIEYLGAADRAVAESGIAFPTRATPVRSPDVVIALAVPGLDRDALVADLDRESAVVAPLLDGARRSGAIVAAHCSASWFLADAGMLDRRDATVSWWLKDAVGARFPRVRWDASRVLVRDGRIYTCGGGFSGLELGRALLRHLGYATEEQQVRKLLVLPPSRQSQTPYEMPLEAGAAGGRALRDRLDTLDATEVPRLKAGDLARRLGLSRRTLLRRFADEMGVTPQDWLTAQRILLARQLLESTELPIADVCHRAGYADVPSFGRLFARRTGMPPGAYRRQSR